MNKRLVLAEKPSVAREIAAAIGSNKKGNGYYDGPKYVVTWALGHLCTLADPDVYDKKYSTWNLDDLPMIPRKMKIVTIGKTRKQYETVKRLLNRSDISEIIIATDAGREGELVARWILEKANSNKPIRRLWISSITKKAILNGFANLKDGHLYDNLYAAAVARAEVDWLVGLNATRALTTKFNAQLSCGRVQTPTLEMINQRKHEIIDFKPVKYYSLSGSLGGLTFNWIGKNNQRIFEKSVLQNLVDRIKNEQPQNIEETRRERKVYPKPLYDLTSLQGDANKMFGYSAKETLNILQKLYEHHRCVTYPRTDSKFLPTDVFESLHENIEACGQGEYRKHAFRILKTGLVRSSRFVDDGKVTDHHAIIPTEEVIVWGTLNERESRLYDIIVKRFLENLMPPQLVEEVKISLSVGGEQFVSKQQLVKSLGWKAISEDNIRNEASVSIPKRGTFDGFNIASHETKPPSRFTEGTLLIAMENPVKYFKGRTGKYAAILGKTGGLGTVATRADIIEKLYNTGYIESHGNELDITKKGTQLLNLVPEDLKSPALTGEWEAKLEEISKGKLIKREFISEMQTYTEKIIQEIKGSTEKYKHDNMTQSKCPECGKNLLSVKNKHGKSLVCQDRQCGYRKSISKITNARCPECHKKLEMRGEGEKKAFYCKCGYKETLTAFNKRKSASKKQGSKRDYMQYMKQQQNDDDRLRNTALADALAKFKLEE